uniref:Uncharacterized protein n=1 Tax=Arundo donax TaxID=35708 RepID=A0A0A9FRD8_ARUDO
MHSYNKFKVEFSSERLKTKTQSQAM